jgi:hypothetical protein
MKLISFDVGIKNMAYCIFDISSGSPISILDWNVINLMEKTEHPIISCNCPLQPKNKNKSNTKQNENQNPLTLCGKHAKYKKEESTFCEKHAKANNEYLMPIKECSPSNIKKLKLQELIDLCKKYSIPITNPTELSNVHLYKKDILEMINTFLKKKMLEPLIELKEKTASETDLITIGKNMRNELNKISNVLDVTHVIIENQISPIANRMKTIQGMLAQYFIMVGSQDIHIEFVSSMNKLKGYTITNNDENNTNKKEENNANKKEENPCENKYKQHKKDSIVISNLFLETNENLQIWKPKLITSKKDDLADCFLQGIWYLKSKKVITNAEDLKIINL